MPPTTPHSFIAIFMILFFFFAFSVHAETVSFEFSSFTLRNITLTGDSYLRNGVVGLIRAADFPTTSSGALLYDYPISLFDQTSNTSSSFSTTFSFSITNLNPSSFGDGIAFILSNTNLSSSSFPSTAGTLGLPTSFVTVEFDTRQDSSFHDPNENHVGFNVNSLNSIATVDPITHGIDLKSGNTITSWIDYYSDKKILTVFLSYSASSKPLSPVLIARGVDLSKQFKDNKVYVGFSASTEGSTELHMIERWSFSSFGFVPARQHLRPHNVSDNTVGVTVGSDVNVNVNNASGSTSSTDSDNSNNKGVLHS